MEPVQSPFERLLDVSLFAPLGFLLGRDQVMRDLAKAGRKQVAFSRSLGRAALQTIAKATAAPETQTRARTTTSTAVPGYEDLTAKQVIALIASCNDAQASWVRDAETEGKHRVTVIRALDARE